MAMFSTCFTSPELSLGSCLSQQIISSSVRQLSHIREQSWRNAERDVGLKGSNVFCLNFAKGWMCLPLSYRTTPQYQHCKWKCKEFLFSGYADFGYFTLLFCRGQPWNVKVFKCRDGAIVRCQLDPLFCHICNAIAVIVCLSSLLCFLVWHSSFVTFLKLVISWLICLPNFSIKGKYWLTDLKKNILGEKCYPLYETNAVASGTSPWLHRGIGSCDYS